ncbi:MAG: hypothetical protein JWQ13_1483 [Ramlibacter sp.]|jgi:hypothetical protein|nr:hypothetical protein [Ramlibacter sp.]
MTDPSFLLQSPAAKDLMELARDLQALVDIRSAALEQPLRPDVDLSAFDAEPEPAPGHRGGRGSESILPYLAQTLAAKPLDGRA